MKKQIYLLKIGGELMSDAKNFALLCQEIAKLKQANIAVVLVHGGGPQVTAWQKKLGYSPTIIDGRRVTDEHDLEALKMIISGKINIEMLAALQSAGIHAVGLSGVDANLLKVCRRPIEKIDYGFVADILSVNPELLFTLIEKNIVPVIAPLAADSNGIIYNINADTVAFELALALSVKKWAILTNVDGVYDREKNIFSRLSCATAKRLINEGVITAGMVPKIDVIISAIQSGIPSVHLVNGLQPFNLATHLIGETGGTVFT